VVDERADAVIAADDVWAVRLIQRLKARGYRVPDDVAVVGYDNSKRAFLIQNSFGTGWGNKGYGWFGYDYIAGAEISAQVITFEAVSDSAVEVHLEVHKNAGTKGYCTLRSQSADGAEVGRADFRFDQHSSRLDQVVTLRTTARGSTAELLGCHSG